MWPPDATLDAAIPDIVLAHEGQIELLTAIFGSPEETPPAEPGGDVADKIKIAMRAMAK